MDALRLTSLLAATLLSGGASAQDDGSVTDAVVAQQGTGLAYQDALDQWWQGASKIWRSETAYRIPEGKGLTYTEGVCTFHLDKGQLIPVYTGEAPVSEEIVGLVWVGEGTAELSFPHRADAWAFSNHMVLSGGLDKADLVGVARMGEPFTTAVDRGMILTAGPSIRDILTGLEPVGAGTAYVESSEGTGVDEVYVVTEKKGELKTKAIATNLLSNRRHLLQRSGLDPLAMLRQDRMLYEELNFPAEHLRGVSDFRTSTNFAVASQGQKVGPQAFDRWLTCYDDGMGNMDTGYRSIAFTHGIDTDGTRHFLRLSGDEYERDPVELVPLPPVRMDPIYAETKIVARPVKMSKYYDVEVETDLTVMARGATQQHLALRMPTTGSVRGSWELLSLTTADGVNVPYVGLRADMIRDADAKALSEQDVESAGTTAIEGSDGVVSNTASTDSSDEEEQADDGSSSGVPQSDILPGDLTETILGAKTISRFEILAILPQPLAEGEEVKLHMKWTARWQYANFATLGETAYVSLGPTTGPLPVLPDLLPALGGTAWNFKTTVGVPGVGLRSKAVSMSGDTTKEWEDDAAWLWITAEGEHVRSPVVAIGQWQTLIDPPFPEEKLPGVKVHLFNAQAGSLREFAPEIRRVLAFFYRFLPEYPSDEIEVFQNARHTGDARRGVPGMVDVSTVSGGGVGTRSEIEEENPHFTQQMIARQVALQYWGQLISPASSRDLWIADAFSDAFGSYYVRAAFGKPDFEQRLRGVRANLVDNSTSQAGYNEVRRYRRSLSLTGGTSLSDVPASRRQDYAFYVVGKMLRETIGDQAYFLALDRVAQRHMGKRLTTYELQATFEETSLMDLSDFFDWWVHAGHIPEVEVEYRVDGDGTLYGCILSDVPFGSFDMPIEVKDKGGKRTVAAMIDVDDARGVFRVPDRKGDVGVEIDPNGLILVYDAEAKKVDKTTCEREGLFDALARAEAEEAAAIEAAREAAAQARAVTGAQAGSSPGEGASEATAEAGAGDGGTAESRAAEGAPPSAVTLTGNAREVYLDRDGTRVELPDAGPGSYKLMAAWGDREPSPVGLVVVKAGVPVSIDCTNGTCTVQ